MKHGTESDHNNFKNQWYKKTDFFRLKVNQHDFKDWLCKHKQMGSPQATQGMWQAYGQMRAARTLARGSVLSTGIFGLGLWVYQQTLSVEKRKIDEGRENLLNTTQSSARDKRRQLEMATTIMIRNEQLQESREYVKKICESRNVDKDKCIKEFEESLNQAETKYESTYNTLSEEMHTNYNNAK